jgi:Uma2 family endonuclease
MTAIQERPLEHMVLSNISWETFESILREMGESHYRVTYDEGELEFMTISFRHDHAGSWIGRLVFFVALEWNMRICTGGSTTLKQSLRKKGLEPDDCFWIKHEDHMRDKEEWDALHDPPPDLSVEIDITSSSLDRLGIYAALKVPEIWRYDGEDFQVLILGANGKYKERSHSLAFPSLPMKEFAGFVKKLGSADEVSLIKQFTAWLRSLVAPKSNGSASRKNGRKR